MSRHLALLAPILAASAFAFAVPAQATSFTGNGSVSIVDGNGSFYDTAIPAGLFTDTINYSVPADGVADIDVIYFKFAISKISNLTAVFNGTALSFTQVGNSFAGVLTKSVSQGPQTLVISGNSAGTGRYSGNVGFSPVPELATWAMMIAGVGFAGVAMRRRKPAYKVNYAF